MNARLHMMLGVAGLLLLAAISTANAKEHAVDAKTAGKAAPPYATLAEALAAAAPGDTIALAAGDYDFAAPKKPFAGKMVTIRPAAGAAGKVRVSRLNGSYSYVRFEGLIIPEPVRIRKPQWVQFVRCTFAPTEKQSYWGASFQDGDHCGLYGCTVATLSTSQINMSGVRNTEYRFNEVTNGDSDAFQGDGDGILIEGNWVHDMHPAPKAHPDGIQLGNTRRLTVRGNVFDCPNMQTFFFSWTAKETVYEDFLIENNVCTTARYHGLTTHPSTDMTIRNNLFICDARHPDGSESIDLKNMKGRLTVVNNLFWQFSVENRAQDLISNNIYMMKHWKSGLPGAAAILSTPDACFVARATRDYRLKEGSPAIGAGLKDNAPKADILGRPRSADRPSIGPLEPQKEDRPFMEMWQSYFKKMQAEVEPPDPK